MSRTNDLGQDRISRLVIRLAIPTMLAQLVNVLYSIVDRMYIGTGVGSLALAGVGVCAPIVTLLTSFGSMVGQGGAPIMAMQMGSGDHKSAKQTLNNGFFMLLVLSAVLTGLFLLTKDQLLMWFGASEATFSYANTYVTIYTAGTFFALISGGLNSFLIAQGFSGLGMATVVLGAVLNIILDPVFIFIFHMGVAGAAIATVISQMASCAFVLLSLRSHKMPVRLGWGGFQASVIRRIVTFGFSPFLILATDSLILIFMNTVLQKYGGASQGDMLITCATIAQSYLLLITSPMIGISGGTQAILSYNYGARCVNRVKDAERNILGVMLIFTTIMFLLSRFIPRYFVLLFTTDPQYIRFSVWVIRTYTLMIIPLSFQYVFVDGLTALECPKTGLALSVTRKSLFVISAAVLPSFFGAKAAFFAEPVADGISSVLSTIVFLLLINRHLDKRCRMDKKESL